MYFKTIKYSNINLLSLSLSLSLFSFSFFFSTPPLPCLAIALLENKYHGFYTYCLCYVFKNYSVNGML
jgi:hypothetical protein